MKNADEKSNKQIRRNVNNKIDYVFDEDEYAVYDDDSCIIPDIIVEQGEFESYEYKTYSESDLRDSLDKEEDPNNDDADIELSDKEKRLAKDYQLQRALDLLKGLSIFEESFE